MNVMGFYSLFGNPLPIPLNHNFHFIPNQVLGFLLAICFSDKL